MVMGLSVASGLTYQFAKEPTRSEAPFKPITTKPAVKYHFPKVEVENKPLPANTYLNYWYRALQSSWQMIECTERLLTYMALGMPVLMLALPTYLLRDIAPYMEEVFWMYSIWTIEMLGPAFVKMAQWASTRPDLYPKVLIERLEKLQDNVTSAYSMTTVENTLTAAFGEGWREHIHLEQKPIGSGCIAQVYRGSFQENSEDAPKPIAVKILHPNVERKVRLDMMLLSGLADVLDRYPRLEILSLGETCRQFVEVMQKQLDLSIEAYNLHMFRDLFAKDTWARFPKPIDQYVTKNVLVEEYMEGKL